MTVLVAGPAFSAMPDLSNAAVTDLNPGVMMKLSAVETEGDAPYIFYAAKPGEARFVACTDGEDDYQDFSVTVRFPGFYRLANLGWRSCRLMYANVPIAVFFDEGLTNLRAVNDDAKLWVYPPNTHVKLEEVSVDEAEERAEMKCAFLGNGRFWHAGPVSLVKAKRIRKIKTQATPSDLERMAKILKEHPLHAPRAKRRVIFFNQCLGYRHSGALWAGPAAFKLAAEKTGAFSLDVETDLKKLTDKNFLSGYDAIVLNSTTSIEESRLPGVGKALTEYVAGGRGLVLLHAAVDAFYNSPEVQKMNGALFFGHPWSAPGTWSFLNERTDHPINAPFKNMPTIMKFSDEIYQTSTPPFDRSECDVLISMDMSDTLTAAAFDRWRFLPYGKDKQRADGDFAVSYTKNYGKGRVFYTSFGHDERAFMDVRLPHMLLALQWALGDIDARKEKIARFADRLWMWGHEPEAWYHSAEQFDRLGMNPSNHCSQAEGCRLMGIKRDCIIRWMSLPKLPVTDEWLAPFKELDEVAWSITDSDKSLSFLDKVDIALEMKKRLPNLTTVFLDDYFQQHMRPLSELETARKRIHASGMKIAAVMYADVEGLRESDLPSARLCDVIALWFWKPDSFDIMEQKTREAKKFLGVDKPLWLGLYMWNFGGAFGPVSGPKMKAQLAVADRLMRDGTVEALVFHPTMSADMDVPSINISKEWIRERK